MSQHDDRTFDHAVLGTCEHISLGLDTFGDAPLEGAPGNHAEAIREVVAEAVLADRVGLDYIGLGEHHRADYAISAPDVVLAAIAGQTNGSASAPASPCCRPTTRSGSTSASRPSTR